MTIPVSDWYTTLGNYSFPTMFIRLTQQEREAFLNDERQAAATRALVAKLDYVIEHLPGSCFVHADVCAPTDSELFTRSDGAVKRGRKAWNMLRESNKVRDAMRSGMTERFALHPYRRMDHSREFRLFIKDYQLRAMSQRFLDKYHSRLHSRQDEIWKMGQALLRQIGDFLPAPDIVIDVYLTASGKLMLLDLNPFAPPTDPLLLRDWDVDWSLEHGLRLVPKPMRLGGDVSVSF